MSIRRTYEDSIWHDFMVAEDVGYAKIRQGCELVWRQLLFIQCEKQTVRITRGDQDRERLSVRIFREDRTQVSTLALRTGMNNDYKIVS